MLAEPAAYTYHMGDDKEMEIVGTCPPNYDVTSHHTNTCILQQLET
jgi:hypothetical protein